MRRNDLAKAGTVILHVEYLLIQIYGVTNNAVVPVCYDRVSIGQETAEFQVRVRCDACRNAGKCQHFVDDMECIPIVQRLPRRCSVDLTGK